MKNTEQLFIQWVVFGLKKPGKTYQGLADALGGIHVSSVAKMRVGEYDIKARDLDAISHYLEEPVPRVGYGVK